MSEYLNTILDRLRNAGYKLTRARRLVLEVIEANHGHVTSADVLDQVHKLDASIGRASVFRTLDLLTQLSIIRPTYIDSSMTPNYVLLPDGHHHHIICINCNRVIEFEECDLDNVKEKLEKEFKVQLTGHLLEFFGLCESCVASK